MSFYHNRPYLHINNFNTERCKTNRVNHKRLLHHILQFNHRYQNRDLDDLARNKIVIGAGSAGWWNRSQNRGIVGSLQKKKIRLFFPTFKDRNLN